ncbi:hypothetical protein SVIOM342S_05804 [Streptomyces violaceorubidus]
MGKRTLSVALLATAMLTVAGCSGGGSADAGETAAAPVNPDGVSGDITVLTNRTDLVEDGTMKKYAAEFNKTYPEVKVKFEGLTDYEGEVKIRMNTEDYGDVLLIPSAVAKGDYPKFFAPLGETSSMKSTYRFTDKTEVAGKTYGIATFGTANGLVYNKALFKKAGITDWPTTTEQFLDDLKAVEDKTGATPYYTNFKDGWPLKAPGPTASARSAATPRPPTSWPRWTSPGPRATTSAPSTPCSTTSSTTSCRRRTRPPPTGRARRPSWPRARWAA